MYIKGIEETLTNLEIAHRQLERSIQLYLDEEDYVSALTLAGAAEEILGKLLNKEGKNHWLDEIMKGALGFLGFQEKDNESQEAKKSKKEITNLANFHKNRMKHHNEEGSLTFTVDAEAANLIARAISNYYSLTKRETGAMSRFNELITHGQGKA